MIPISVPNAGLVRTSLPWDRSIPSLPISEASRRIRNHKQPPCPKASLNLRIRCLRSSLLRFREDYLDRVDNRMNSCNTSPHLWVDQASPLRTNRGSRRWSKPPRINRFKGVSFQWVNNRSRAASFLSERIRVSPIQGWVGNRPQRPTPLSMQSRTRRR